MKYYRTKGDFHDYFTGWTTIEGELVTPRERETRFRYLKDSCFEEVEVSKKKTFISFGMRKEIK